MTGRHTGADDRGSSRVPRCFIIAPARAPLSVLRLVLLRQGVQCTTVSDLSFAGTAVSEAILAAIAEADFTVVVLCGNDPSSHAMLGAGMALGRRSPLAIVAERGAALPPSLASTFVVRSDLDNARALDFALAQFVANLPALDEPRAGTRARRKAGSRKAAIRKPIGLTDAEREALRKVYRGSNLPRVRNREHGPGVGLPDEQRAISDDRVLGTSITAEDRAKLDQGLDRISRDKWEVVARRLERARTERAMSELVEGLLGMTESVVVRTPVSVEGVADLAVWVSALRPDLNPVLVSVKSSPPTTGKVSRLLQHLQGVVERAKPGLFVMLVRNLGAGGLPRGVGDRSGSVLILDAAEFARELRDHRLAEVLQRHRNELVHGT